MGKYLTIFFMSLFLLSSCAPKEFRPQKPETIQFEKEEPYSIDLNQIAKPDKLMPTYLDENFEQVSVDQAKYILLTPKEYAKIAAILKICSTYKEIINEQTKLINIEIEKSNGVKEYIMLEQRKRDGYYELWVISENAYRQEKYYHDVDRYSNYFLFGGITIIVLLIAL